MIIIQLNVRMSFFIRQAFPFEELVIREKLEFISMRKGDNDKGKLVFIKARIIDKSNCRVVLTKWKNL